MVEIKTMAPGERYDFAFKLDRTEYPDDTITTVNYTYGDFVTFEDIGNDGDQVQFWISLANNVPLNSRCDIKVDVETSSGRSIVRSFELLVVRK